RSDALRSLHSFPTRRSSDLSSSKVCTWAEMAASIEGLFGAPVQPSPRGGRAVWVKPSDAVRSVCGCVPCDIRFQIYTHEDEIRLDRKSTRLNSSHDQISYAV